MNRTFWRWCQVFILMLAPVLALRAAAPLTPEQLLPADTIAVVSVPNVVKAKAFVEASNYGKLWQDPEMRPFKEKTLTRLKEGFLEPVEKQLGFKLSDYAEFFQGQATFAITPGMPGSNAFGYILIFDAGTNAARLQTNLTILRKKWVDARKQIKTEKIREIEFTSLMFTGEDWDLFLERTFPDPETKAKKKDLEERRKVKFEVRFGQADSLFLFGTHNRDLERVLARKAGEAIPPLAEEATYQPQHAALFRDATAFCWINMKPIVARWIQRGQASPPQTRAGGLFTFRPEKALTAFGLASLRTISLKLGGNAEGRIAEAFLDVPEGARQGIFKLISIPAGESSPPAFVPADATKFRRWRLDGKAAWSQLEAIVLGVAPEIAGLLQIGVETVGKDKDPKFDFRQSFIANLGNDIITYRKPPRPGKPQDVDSPPTIYLIGSPKAEDLTRAFRATSSLMPPPMSSGVVKEREFLGRTIFSVPFDGVDPKNGSLSFVGTGGYMALSTEPGMIEEYIRSGESNHPRLADSAGLKEAAQKVGGLATGLFGYENQTQTMRTTIESWKADRTGWGDKLLAAGGAPVSKIRTQENELFDFSSLPPFEKISKYFGIAVFTGQTTPQGLSFKLFVPTPPNLPK